MQNRKIFIRPDVIFAILLRWYQDFSGSSMNQSSLFTVKSLQQYKAIVKNMLEGSIINCWTNGQLSLGTIIKMEISTLYKALECWSYQLMRQIYLLKTTFNAPSFIKWKNTKNQERIIKYFKYAEFSMAHHLYWEFNEGVVKLLFQRRWKHSTTIWKGLDLEIANTNHFCAQYIVPNRQQRSLFHKSLQ